LWKAHRCIELVEGGFHMDGTIKGLIVGGVIFTAGLVIIGTSINKSAEAGKEQGKAVQNFQQRQLEIMEQAMERARIAQQMQQQHMEMMQREMEMLGAGEVPAGYYDDSFQDMGDGGNR
jgi:hypothetical protein